MKHLRTVALLAVIGLPACVSPYEKTACSNLAAYPRLATPPADVESLYLLPDFGRLPAGYHEHWYEPSDDRLIACRHLKRERGSCATAITRFVRTRSGWQLEGSREVIICAN